MAKGTVSTFEWKTDYGAGDPTPQLGIGLGLKFIHNAIKAAGNDYDVLWNDKSKEFIIVNSAISKDAHATAIVFGDLELLQNGSPEALADAFETKVQNAIMTLQQSAWTKRVRGKARG